MFDDHDSFAESALATNGIYPETMTLCAKPFATVSSRWRLGGIAMLPFLIFQSALASTAKLWEAECRYNSKQQAQGKRSRMQTFGFEATMRSQALAEM
jgi:hypothetical protein